MCRQSECRVTSRRHKAYMAACDKRHQAASHTFVVSTHFGCINTHSRQQQTATNSARADSLECLHLCSYDGLWRVLRADGLERVPAEGLPNNTRQHPGLLVGVLAVRAPVQVRSRAQARGPGRQGGKHSQGGYKTKVVTHSLLRADSMLACLYGACADAAYSSMQEHKVQSILACLRSAATQSARWCKGPARLPQRMCTAPLTAAPARCAS